MDLHAAKAADGNSLTILIYPVDFVFLHLSIKSQHAEIWRILPFDFVETKRKAIADVVGSKFSTGRP